MKKFFKKSLLNQKIYLVPTGNSVKNDGTSPFDQYTTAIVNSFSRVNATLTLENHLEPTQMRISSSSQPQLTFSRNFGYLLFSSFKEMQDQRVSTLISKKLSGQDLMTGDQALAIAGIMGWEV